MSKKVFFNFAPHLGDLLISRGIANGLAREKDERSVSCTYLPDKDIYDYLQSDNFEIRFSKDKKDYDIPVIHKGINIVKNYLGGSSFQYIYEPTKEFLQELKATFEAQINDGVFEGVEKIYSLHMQFNVVYLGYYLEKYYGIKAEGYAFMEKEGKYYLNVDNVWCKDGIIQHFGNLLGITPIFEDFVLPIGWTDTVKSDTVLLLPDSRHACNLSNQHWELAEKFFKKEGYQVQYGIFGRDYTNIKELADIIREKEIIVTNDSFPYHLAWTMEKDIILKEKLGVLSEWTHRDNMFVKRGKTYSIPPAPVYEEEYIQHLIYAMDKFKGRV